MNISANKNELYPIAETSTSVVGDNFIGGGGGGSMS